MSVPSGKRGDSSMEFVNTANIIEQRTMEVCKNWPKSYRYVITQRTINLASEIYEDVQRANAIRPATEEERQQRISLLFKALGATRAFSQKIERAFNLFPICSAKPEKAGMSETELKAKKVDEDNRSWHIFQEFMAYCSAEEKAIQGNINFTSNMKLEDPKKRRK